MIDAMRFFGLDSLTDIVSNAIGIAILLALVTFLSSVSRTYEVAVPLAQPSALVPRFYVAKDDALWPVDRAGILRRLAARASSGGPTELPLAGGRVTVELTGDAGFVIRRLPSSGWVPRADLARRRLFDELDPTRELAFFFVYDTPRRGRASGSGFDALRDARRVLAARGVRAGWTIVSEEHPPRLCASSIDPSCRYRPSTP